MLTFQRWSRPCWPGACLARWSIPERHHRPASKGVTQKMDLAIALASKKMDIRFTSSQVESPSRLPQ